MKDEIFTVCFKINSLSCFFLHDALLYLYYAEYNNYLTHYIVIYIYNRMGESVVFTNLVTAARVASGWCAIAVTSCMSCDTTKRSMSSPKYRSVEVINNPARPRSNHRKVNCINYK